jgi:hypothetical protein
MRLNDLDNKNVAAKALKENFSIDFDVSNLDRSKTRTMLNKVRGLISESKRSPEFHAAQHNPAYLKLVFMEQTLSQHINVAKAPRIVFENEEVEKSQVILAAQDMIDTIQKMYEDVNDMLVKELPALVDSIQSEIGVNESDAFNQTAGETLTALNASLQEAQGNLKTALAGLTGQAGGDAFAPSGPDLGGEEDIDLDIDLDAEMPAEEPTDGPAELPPIPDLGDEEEAPTGGVGRAKR